MRQFTSLCSIHRHSVLLKNVTLFNVNHIPVRYSSLSAIHRGLRDSEKSRPQGFSRDALDNATAGRAKRTSSRTRRDPDWTPPGFKIKRGPKDITDKGPSPKLKRERFHDPTESFGKKSHVYQAKHGRVRGDLDSLKSELKAVGGQNDFESKFSGKFKDDFGSKSSSRSGDDRRRTGSGAGRSSRPSSFAKSGDRSARSFGSRSDYKPAHGSNDRRSQRPDDRGTRDSEYRRTPRFDDRGSGSFDQKRTTRSDDLGARTYEHQSSPGSNDRGSGKPYDRPARPARPARLADGASGFGNASRDEASVYRSTSSRDDLPIRIHHTTAASQFLYGRSVVEAALKASRRRVYHLYLYAGRDRQNLVQDATLEKLANEKGVKVTKIVDNDGLRMMDKMSVGRPHNGCILETSPTPQIPLKALGKLSEDEAKRGFDVELSYQSAEETAINGTPDFITYQANGNRKPFFLLLDGILDPGNLGAILRTAAFLGVTGVVISQHGSSGLTPVSLKASSGASEVLPLYSVKSTPDFVERSKENGWMIYASVAAGPRSRGNSHLTLDRIETYDPLGEHPTILVIGSEGEGLEKKIKRLADFEVSIPGQPGFLNTIDSLNVSVATGIMCSAFLKKNQGFEIEESMNEIKQKEEANDDSQLW